MIQDKQHEMSNAQAFTAAEETMSTNVIDFGAGFGGKFIGGSVMELIVRVQTAFTSGGAATLVVLVETDSTAAFSSATALFTSATLALATVAVAGYTVVHMRLPITTERFLRCTYTIGTTTMTAGAVDAWVNIENESAVLGA